MARMWIVEGDRTTGGGKVISSSTFTDIDGMGVARIDDAVTCLKHQGIQRIVEGDPTLIVDGKPVAVHGCAVSCGCKVQSAEQVHVFVDAGGSRSATESAQAAVQAASAGAVASELLKSLQAVEDSSMPVSQCDEAIRFVSGSGRPLRGVNYRLHLANGDTVHGQTGSDGTTSRVRTTSPEAIVRAVLVSPEGASCCASLAGMPLEEAGRSPG